MNYVKRLGATAAAVMMMIQGSAWAEMRIGVAMSQFDDNYLTTVRRYMDDKAKATPGVSLQFEDGRADVVRQLNQVQSFVSQGVDAIIVIPVDTAATKNITDAAVAAKIPLIYVNRKPNEPTLPEGVISVTSDDYQAGVMQMEFLAKQINGKGNVAIMLGDLANNSTHARTKGVHDVIKKYPDIKIVQEQTAVWLRDRGMDLMSNWLLSGTQIDAVAANNDEMGIGAAMALRQAGKKKGQVPVGGTDGTSDGVAAVKNGLLAVSVLQDAKGQGYGALDAAVKMIHKQKVENVVIPYQLITKDNVASFMAASK